MYNLDVKIQISNYGAMVISQTAEYALRAVICLANQPKRPVITAEIAKQTQVPAGYLSKVLQVLGRVGLVRSQRGLHGGFVLAKPADQLTVLEVIDAVEPLKRIERCPLGLESHDSVLCSLHQRLDKIVAQAEEALSSFTIQDLLSQSKEITPLGLAPQEEEGSYLVGK
jgi:Rrf2 family nitric oxide-sensitive transcriptional repressor